MKKQYRFSAQHVWFILLWLLSVNVFAQAQQSPVIQWQRVLESNTPFIRAVKAANGGYALLLFQRVIRLSESGNTIWEAQLPNIVELYNHRITAIASTPDGGFGLVVRGNGFWYIARLNADGALLWLKPFERAVESGSFLTDEQRDILHINDGSFVVMGIYGGGRGTTVTRLYKLDGEGNQLISKTLEYPYQNTIRFGSAGSRIVQTIDGGFLVVGNTSNGTTGDVKGWAAKLDAQLNPIWQQRYEERSGLTDVILSPYFNGTFIASGTNDMNRTISQSLNIGAAGDTGGGFYQPGKVEATPTLIVSQPAMNGAPTHAILDNSSQNGGDFRLTNLTFPDQIVWTKTLGGSGNDVPSDLIATDDGGYLLVGTTTSTDGDVQGKTNGNVSLWAVKLGTALPTNPLTLTQPTYNCQTGAITFNTTGGNGSPITYSAPGITRASVTDNYGTVEQELRNDPKPITITATQIGYTTSYTFDFGANCSSSQYAPTLIGQIPDQTRTVGVQIVNDIIPVSSYFRLPSAPRGFRPVVNYKAEGLPDGMLLFDASNEGQNLAYIGGTPTKVGVYTVTISAFVSNLPDKPTTTTTFKISIVDTPTPGRLSLTAPGYNCQTGAITFNTTGGDGSTIEYRAAGITDWTTNPNQFVDRESRTANDVQPFTLMARQSGQVVTYTWDLKAACGRNAARMASLQPESKLLITVLGNPVSDELRVRIEGSAGQPVGLQLIDASGRLIDGRRLEIDQAGEEQRFDLCRQRPGLLILRAGAGTQTITTKIIKQ